MRWFTHKTFFSFFLLTIITIVGAILRFHNISPFKIYPDSYQNLLVAYNISHFGNVVGILGKGGMVYPDFFMWTRPGYALLINFISLVTHNTALSAQIIAIISGIAAIPAVYFLLRRYFQSHAISLCGAFLLSTSFSHVIWSGYIMTETIGVFFLLSFLITLFFSIQNRSKRITVSDIFSGILFTSAVFTRYEYIVLVIPVVLIVIQTKLPLKRIGAIAITFTVLSLLFITQLYPIAGSVAKITSQLNAFIYLATIALVFIIAGGTSAIVLPQKFRKSFRRLYPYFLITVLCIFFAVMILEDSLYPAFTKFILYDRLLVFSAGIGMILMLLQKRFQPVLYFILLSIALLCAMYYRINPEMERYMTHIFPFFIIPAGYGLYSVINRIRQTLYSPSYLLKGGAYISIVFLLILTAQQIIFSYSGLHNWPGGWHRMSYEEKAARHIAEKKYNGNMLLVSFPEPYFYFSNISTQSIATEPPYVYIDSQYNRYTLIIVQDMGMRDQFPLFSAFLTDCLHREKKDTFWVNERYHYESDNTDETNPVEIYTIKLDDLKKRIEICHRKH